MCDSWKYTDFLADHWVLLLMYVFVCKKNQTQNHFFCVLNKKRCLEDIHFTNNWDHFDIKAKE